MEALRHTVKVTHSNLSGKLKRTSVRPIASRSAPLAHLRTVAGGRKVIAAPFFQRQLKSVSGITL